MNSTLATTGNIRLGARSETSKGFVARYATAATIATFLVVAITGVLLFYHIGGPYLRTAHDWLGMAFVVAAIFHVVRNWNGCVKLLKQPRTQVVLLLVAATTAACVLGDSLSAGTYGGGKGRYHGEATPTTETIVNGVG